MMDKELISFGIVLLITFSIGVVFVVEDVIQKMDATQEEIPRIQHACNSCNINATVNTSDCEFCKLVTSNAQT